MTALDNLDSAADLSNTDTQVPDTHDVKIDNSNRSTTPQSDRFLDYISSHWADRPEELPAALPVTAHTGGRRAALSALFTGKRLVIHAGAMKQRSNDTFYQYRPHSAFAHLTGWGSESEPGAILVLDPTPNGHEATLYFRERAGRDSDEFFANPEIGEFWIGPRPSLAQVAAALDVPTAPLEAFESTEGELTLENEELARAASELRLVKDSYEIVEMQAAVDATAKGFEDVLAALPKASAHKRGERIVEGVFNQRARLDGNTVGYETIAAAGSHACTLHWIRNDGDVREGDLLLLDAGVELDSLYTADITRTVPISGTFSPVQRRVYEAVLEAADAARAIVKPGIRFGDVHEEAMKVIERYTREWGFLPSAENDPTAYYRRYMVHGTSHHLGMDVHDCAQARRELYLDGVLRAGMVFTIEPGLYFQPDDLTVPEEYRGIGVRIEDDIVVTDDGCVNLSAGIPRTADDVESWIKNAQQ
ncbi:aminopeptidase P family protein [Leucobacter viscericola]|uniref:Xaa-Pro aminopeptidase n=1 Tax=Leucobacter viscericola TaxID=2714935 RepID=A0A6G7XD22_9MICO|nr:aminopeptidase P family protein [Leucobacter viscericola]QIK62271.1 aminopeptidase P family protein [Leucobacter viscericola]